MTNRETFSLYQLNQLIRSVIEDSLPDNFLITAEIASINIRNHCYMSLVDKHGETITAELPAVIWAGRYRTLSQEFRDATGIELSRGIRILFEASVTFHERYGLKLNILNIDPSYTTGELAVRRKEILERLSKEGLKDRNKALELPLVPQRIGIISSPSAAGYEDLMGHLENNAYGYRFFCRMYEALMQGDRAEASVISALEQCGKDSAELDAVVIVRGGGGVADLHCFDSYGIAKAIAHLSLPVISGIGHQRDITVVDEVSNTRVKTPTAAADLLVTKLRDFEDTVDELSHSLARGAKNTVSDVRDQLSAFASMFESSVRNELAENIRRIDILIKGLKYSLKLIHAESERLRSKESNISHLNPRNVLKRGYSITYREGAAVRSVSGIRTGEIIKTVLYSGELTSIVESRRSKRTPDSAD